MSSLPRRLAVSVIGILALVLHAGLAIVIATFGNERSPRPQSRFRPKVGDLAFSHLFLTEVSRVLPHVRIWDLTTALPIVECVNRGVSGAGESRLKRHQCSALRQCNWRIEAVPTTRSTFR